MLPHAFIHRPRLEAHQHINKLLSCLDDGNTSIEDPERLSKCLLAVAHALTDTDTISPLLDCTPAVYGVEGKTWFEVLRCILNSQLQGIPEGLLALGVLQELRRSQVAELKQLAQDKGDELALAVLRTFGRSVEC